MSRWPGPNYYEPDDPGNDPCEDGHFWDDPEELAALGPGETVYCLREGCDARGIVLDDLTVRERQ